MAIKFPNIPPFLTSLSVRFGTSPDDMPKYLRDHDVVLQKEFGKRTPDDTARKSVILSSTDDASVWEITVNHLGTLTATKVLG